MALRTPLSVTPHLYMGDSTGRPLDKGVVYFGEQDKDPEFYPINLFSDDALTKPLAQPVHTKGGYLYDKGDMVEPHAKEIIYSVKVLDSYGRKVFYKGAMMRNSWNDDVIEQINTAIIGSADAARQVAIDITNDAINNTAIEGGVLADTFVVVDGSLSQKTINKGLESIADLSTIKNPKNGLRVYVKSYHAGLGKGGGYFIYDSTKASINNGGTIINGWIRESKNKLNPYDFGAIGDGTHHALSGKFNTLADAKRYYAHAISLEDSLDWVALQGLLNYCHDNFVDDVDMTINGSINRPLQYLGQFHATKQMRGHLKLTATAEMQEVVWLQGWMFKFNGTIEVTGYYDRSINSYLNRKCNHGVRIGGDENGVLNNSEQLYIKEVRAIGFAQNGVFCDQNSMFVKIDTVIGRECGSGSFGGNPTTPHQTLDHTTNYSDLKAGVSEASYKQNSVLKVDSLPPDVGRHGTNIFCDLGGDIYTVIGVDRAANTLVVFPLVDNTQPVSGKLTYHYGAALHTSGNNSGCIKVGSVQAILSGAGFSGCALYGSEHGNIITEYCGMALVFGRVYEAMIGYNIGNVYFETNRYDLVNVWDVEPYNHVRIHSTQGIDLHKIRSMYIIRVPWTNKLRDEGTGLPKGLKLNYLGKEYQREKSTYNEVNWTGIESVDLTSPTTTINFLANQITLAPTVDLQANKLFGYDSINVTVNTKNKSEKRNITVIAPKGWTVNGLDYFIYDNLKLSPTIKLTADIASKDIKTSVDVGYSALSEPTSGYYEKGDVVQNSGADTVIAYWINTVTGFATNTAFSANTSVDLNAYIFNDSNVYRVSVAGNLGADAPVHTSGTTTNGTTQLEYVGKKCVFKTVNFA